MKLPSSKIYWTDYLAYSTLLSPEQICDVLKAIATRALTYPDENPQDNPQVISEKPTGYPTGIPTGIPADKPKLKLKQILKQKYNFNNIQLEFFDLLATAQDESAKDYLASVRNGRKGGRPKKTEDDKSRQIKTGTDKTISEIIKETGKALSGKKSNNSIFVDNSFCLLNYPEFRPYIEEVTPSIIESVETWIRNTKQGQSVSVEFITKQFVNFANRQGRPIFKEQTNGGKK